MKWRLAGALACAAAALAAAPSTAQARGFVGLSVGAPLYYPPPPPVYYYPPPAVVYAPPPPAYPPAAYPPAAYPPPGYAAAPAPVAPSTCREYQSTSTIDGRPQRTFGTACLQPDGTWRIVR